MKDRISLLSIADLIALKNEIREKMYNTNGTKLYVSKNVEDLYNALRDEIMDRINYIIL